MKRLRVHRQGAEEHVVHLGHGTADRMLEDLAFREGLEIQPGHDTSRAPPLPSSDLNSEAIRS
jgi:hypothetical protein